MGLAQGELNCSREKKYFVIAAVFAVLVWIGVLLTIVGGLIAVVIGIFAWLGNGLLVAHLRSSCVRVHEKQLPELYESIKEVCERLGVPVPEVYVLQSEGHLNAFAMRHCGRDFIVLFSNLIDEFDPRGDEIRFYVGHEIGHIKSRHIAKQIFLMTSTWLPLLGPAYFRACEESCDRFGAFSVNNTDGAVRAMVVLASGRSLSGKVDVDIFARQAVENRGFFVSWYELISGYRTLSQRVAALVAIKNDQLLPSYPRNPFSYVFALFSFGGGREVGGIFIVIAVVAMMAAIAIPNLLRAKISANDALARGTLRSLSTAAETYATANSGIYPETIMDLTNATPPYINNNYCERQISGYTYSCRMGREGYTFTAFPVSEGSSGSSSYTITTGGVLTP